METKEDITSKYKFDMLRMYFGEPYDIKLLDNRVIRIIQPTIGDMLKYGEDNIYSVVNPFLINTTSYRLPLWDKGIDWNDINDFELFSLLVRSIDINISKLIFKGIEYKINQNYDISLSEEKNLSNGNSKYIETYWDIDFSKLHPYDKQLSNEDGEVILDKNDEPKVELVLYSNEQDLLISEDIYMQMREYLRTVFDQHPKEEFAKGKTAKKWIIEYDKQELEKKSKDKNLNNSILLPLVSALINHPGFKYKLNELKEVPIFQFMDSVQRLQTYEQCTSFMKGMYSGMMDTSKMGQEELNNNINWLKDLHSK